jgi:hypothetical protein
MSDQPQADLSLIARQQAQLLSEMGTAAGRPIQLTYAPKAVQEFIRKSLVSDNLEIADRPINQLHIAAAGMGDAPGVAERPLRDFLQGIARSGMEI